MNKKLKNIGQSLLWIGVAAALLFFLFRKGNLKWDEFLAALRECRWGFVLLSMVMGGFVYFLRGLRWRMLLLPVDPSTSWITTWNAYNICVASNVVLPRVGEVIRCGFITRHSARDEEGRRLASFDKVLGTVVLERLWDIVSILIVLVILLIVMWDKFGVFFSDNVLSGISGKASLAWILVPVVLLAALFVWLCWRFRERGGIWGKVWGVIQGFIDGLTSCMHMRNGWLFIVYTVAIWGLYWLMSASVMWSLQGVDPASVGTDLAAELPKIDRLGMDDALFLMFAGALSALIPVPGGFGAFHGAICLAFSTIYGIPIHVGMIFAILSHESQVLVNILCGTGSYLHETLFRR